MASLQLGAAWVVLGSSLKLRIGFRNKRCSRVAERSWRFRAQLRTKQKLVRFAKRSESLRYILKQYGVSVEKLEENKTRSRVDCEEKHNVATSSDSKMNTMEELPDLRRQEKYSETVITSGQNHHISPHLKASGVLFTCLLPVFGLCIMGRIISRNLNKDHRWTSALSDWSEPTFPPLGYKVASENQEGTEEAYNRVELEYRRFLAECGVSES